jgi:hypothetical protein
MDKRIAILLAAILVVIIGVGGVLIGRYVLGPGSSSEVAALLDEKTRELEDRTKQIEDLEKQAEVLRKDLDEGGKQVAELQSRLDQANRGLASMQDKLKTTRASRAPRDTLASAPSGGSADAGSYETIRSTSVFAQASVDSKKITTIAAGTKINVVGSVGDWLEVRSKRGNPPGYIRREDAMYKGPN